MIMIISLTKLMLFFDSTTFEDFFKRNYFS